MRRFSTRNFLGLGLLGVLLAAYLALFKDTLIDDAFITLCYARTLVESGTWGMFPGHTANVVTSPLNVLLLALPGLLVPSLVDVALALALIELIALAVCLRGIASQLELPLFAPIAFVAFLCNPLFMSTMGLESILMTTLLVASLQAFVTKRWTYMAIASALTTLARPDGLVFVAVLLTAVPTLRMRARTLGVYLLCLVPWGLFSWIHLGSLIPDTFILKTSVGWGSLTFSNSIPFYFRAYPFEVAVTCALLPFALLVVWRPARGPGGIIQVIGAMGIAHFAAYTVLHVAPFHWYYVPQVISIVLLGALSVASLHRMLAARRLARALVALAFLLPVAGQSIAIARRGVPLEEALVHTNWATSDQYRHVGLWLQANHGGETIRMQGEVGTLAYYSDCCLVDAFGDRSWLNEARKNLEGGGVKSLLYRLNFLFYEAPPPFRPASYCLQAMTSRENPVPHGLMTWDTSSHWVPTGRISFQRSEVTPASDLLGQTLFRQGDYAGAVAQFQQAVELGPEDAGLHFRLATALVRSGRAEEAIQHYREALRLEPAFQDAHIDLSALFMEQNKPSDALSHLLRALEILPNSAGEQFNLGQVLRSLARFDEAMAAFREASRLAPEQPEPYSAFAKTVCMKPDASPDERQEALRLAKKASEMTYSKRPDLLEIWALTHAALGDFPSAAALVDEALKLPGPSRNEVFAGRLRALREDYRSKTEQQRSVPR